MSWSWPPDGIEFAVTSANEQIEPITPSTSFYPCLLMNGSTLECVRLQAQSDTIVAPIGTSLAAIPDIYDWYTIQVHASFPRVPGAHTECYDPPSVFGSGCKHSVPGNSHGSFDVDLVNFGSGAAISNAGDSGLLGAGWKIDPDAVAAVVNPSPTYPIPDAHGNEAGAILWTRAQVAAVVGGIELDYAGAWGNAASPNVIVTGVVAAYNEIGATPTSPPFMCLL